jgi:sec-independent protein translocase protein TatA
MGIGGMSLGSLLIVLVIVMLLFGTKRLRGIGSDLGGALSGFRRAVKEGEDARDTLVGNGTARRRFFRDEAQANRRRPVRIQTNLTRLAPGQSSSFIEGRLVRRVAGGPAVTSR